LADGEVPADNFQTAVPDHCEGAQGTEETPG